MGYYSTVLLGMTAAHFYPQLNTVAWDHVNAQLEGTSGGRWVTGVYESKRQLLAALVTFAVNLSIGAFGTITLPSMLVPLSGVLLAVYRAGSWGLLFSPGLHPDTTGYWAEVPHVVTLVIEGEPYVIAAWGSWIAARMVWEEYTVHKRTTPEKRVTEPKQDGIVKLKPTTADPSKSSESPAALRSRLWSAYKRAWKMTGALYVPITCILAVAAIWEAFEVIHMPNSSKM